MRNAGLTAGLLAIAALGACAGGPPPRPKLEPKDPEQANRQANAVKKAFLKGGEDFDTAVDACLGDPAVVAWAVKFLYLHMDHAMRRHREAEARLTQRGEARPDGLVAPSLEDNPRYTRARGGIVRLGVPALDTVVPELLFHSQRAFGDHGIDIIAHMGVAALPRLREELPAAEPRMRERIVRCVAMMRSENLTQAQQIESQLLDWAESPDRFIRAGALQGLARHGERHLDRLCLGVREDPDDFVRRQLAKILADYPTRRAASALVAFYAKAEEEGDGLSAKVAEDALRSMAGVPPMVVNNRVRPYGLARWRNWLSKRKFDK